MIDRAILLGAIGTVVDTSDMQRRAFNAAFEEAKLDWSWEPAAYKSMLSVVGGANRIGHYAKMRGETVDCDTLHKAKSRIYQEMLRSERVSLRPGITAMLASAHASGRPLAWVTTTSRDNIDAIFDATGDALTPEMFRVIVDRGMVDSGKPAPDCYHHALDALALTAGEVVAVEDTPESAEAAVAAGIETLGFPGTFAPDATWPDGVIVTHDLPGHLLPIQAAAQAAE